MVVELIAKDKNENLQYEGRCKLKIDSISRLLLVEPFIEEYKMISAMFKWKFIAKKNILFVFAEHDFQDFAIIFDHSDKCEMAWSFLHKKGATVGDAELVEKRFIPSLLNEISKNDVAAEKLKEILFKWIELLDGKEKEEYIQILKDNNVYNLFFPKTKENNRRILRKRNIKSCLVKQQNSDSDETEIYNSADTKISKSPPSKRTKFSHTNLCNKIIFKPYFEIIEFKHLGITRKRLFLFPSNDKNKCYEYYWCNSDKIFRCCACARKVKRVRANIYQRLDGTEYVKCGEAKHICKMRDYRPQKYIIDPSTDIVEKPHFKIFEYTKNGIQKQTLVVFCLTNKKLCYEYARQKGRYFCLGCNTTKKDFVYAKVCKSADGNDYVTLSKRQHHCDLREFDSTKFKSDIVIPASMYQIFESAIKSKHIKKQLHIFTSTEKKYFYKFTYSIPFKNFYCTKCSNRQHMIRAYICKDENGQEFISLRDKKHICEPIEYCPEKFENKIIKAPGYEIIKRRHASQWLQKLVVFDANDNSNCYEYFWQQYHKAFICSACVRKHVHVQAKIIKNVEGEEFVQLGQNDHHCTPRKYVPEDLSLKIVKKPDFKVENFVRRGVENTYLFVNNSDDKNLWYKYVLNKKEKRFHCRHCRNRCVTAKLLQDENGEEYIELNKTEHECQPKQYSSKSNIINPPNFKLFDNGKVLLIFCEENRSMCYTYHYRPSSKKFICRKCKSINKIIVSAALRYHDDSGEEYVEMGKNEHICKPEKYELQDIINTKILKPNFKILNSGKKLIVYDQRNNNFYYQYFYCNTAKKFICNGCKSMKKFVTAKILQNENGEDYVELGKINHVCQSKQLH